MPKLAFLIGPNNSNKNGLVNSKFSNFIHINVDNINRKEAICTEARKNKQNVLIDLQNYTKADRKKYIDLFKHNDYTIYGYLTYKGKNISDNISKGSSLVDCIQFSNVIEEPDLLEGFSSIENVDLDQYPETSPNLPLSPPIRLPSLAITSPTSKNNQRALFFDVDAIFAMKNGSSLKLDNIIIHEYVVQQFRIFKSHGFKIIGVVTDLKKTHTQTCDVVNAVLAKLRINIDHVYVPSPTEKWPSPALALHAQKKYNLDLLKSLVVGYDSAVNFSINAKINNFVNHVIFFSEKGFTKNHPILNNVS